MRLLDGLQNRRVEGCAIPAVLVHALVATAREDYGRDISDREALLAVQRAHTALRQILQWIGASPFDAENLFMSSGPSGRAELSLRTKENCTGSSERRANIPPSNLRRFKSAVRRNGSCGSFGMLRDPSCRPFPCHGARAASAHG